ncbi:MAG: hypothetical protein ACR2PG_03760 [Hyphomicrobiaceae bacterium]
MSRRLDALHIADNRDHGFVEAGVTAAPDAGGAPRSFQVTQSWLWTLLEPTEEPDFRGTAE